MGGQWAVSQDVPVRAMPADWSDLSHPGAVIRTSRYGQYDARAGHRRNQSMLDEAAPDYAIAFPGGTGTADMVRRIIAARLPLWDLRADQA